MNLGLLSNRYGAVLVAGTAIFLSSCGASARDFWTWSVDKRVQALAAAQKNLESAAAPNAQVHSQIHLSHLLLTFVRDAALAGDMALVRERLQDYQAAIETAYRILSERRDPARHWRHYKKLEIALRLQERQLADIRPILRVEDRESIESTIAGISAIRERVLLSLFG